MTEKKAAVFMLLGQSNASGHRAWMTEEDKLLEPLKNVFGLRREENQNFDSRELVWSGYTSHSMNLGETQDDTHSISNCLAKLWQEAIDKGIDLPDLYIVHVSIGGQSLSPAKYWTKDKWARNMWDPDREKIMFPGRLEDEVDISLYPLTTHVFSLLDESFKKMGKPYELMGLHWRGGENEYLISKEELVTFLPGLYERFFQGLYDSLGAIPPVVLYKLVFDNLAQEEDSSGGYLESMRYVNQVFEQLCQKHANMCVFDATGYPGYEPDTRTRGLFQEDGCHFLPQVNQWAAAKIVQRYLADHPG